MWVQLDAAQLLAHRKGPLTEEELQERNRQRSRRAAAGFEVVVEGHMDVRVPATFHRLARLVASPFEATIERELFLSHAFFLNFEARCSGNMCVTQNGVENARTRWPEPSSGP